MSSVIKQRPKLTDSKDSNEGVDRISELPEPILINILSLLPTHLAVQTSLLSNRWKFLWKNIYNLSFDDTNHTSLTWFALLVNKVLTSLNEQSIDKFSLHIFKNDALYDVTSWISAAISKNAKVIEFVEEEDYHKFYDMPSSLYSCKTLENLSLKAQSSLINVPNLVSLPNLKTLDLDVNLWDESISELISGCSSLENLEIKNLFHEGVHTLTILSPTLQNLSLKDFDTTSYLPEDDSTLIEDSKIVINAPQLRYLNLYDVETRIFSVENLCLLDEAHINLSYVESDEPLIYEQYSEAVLNLFQGLYNVKTLSLGKETFQALSYGDVIPRFSRLSKLTVEVGIDLRFLINLLESCNQLQSLTLSLDKHYCKEVSTICWIEPENVPICFLSSLHTISVHGIKDHGFEMIAYMLQNAKVLRSMEIQTYDFNAKVKLLDRILNVPRGCAKCQVIFLNPVK